MSRVGRKPNTNTGPANKRSNQATGKKGNDVDQEVTLQAVVLADSFQNRFRPLTLEKPRCLLLLANTPLIEYTFEFLALAGVEDVYVFCCAHSDQIDEYIRNSKWSSPHSAFKKLQTIVSPNSSSVGDAMRELDAKQLITADFLLVHGDIVSNLPLEDILQQHRERRQTDKNAIMTMILRAASLDHRTKSQEDRGVFMVDEATMRCVHYQELGSNDKRKQLSIPPELFKRHPELKIRADLIDCSLDICSPDVPALFTENFDYQQIRRHFVHGILQDYELYGKTIHCYIANHHYAARVRSLSTYDAVTKDIISRWTYPLCPDTNMCEGQEYKYQWGHIYKENDVVLGRSCVIKEKTIIGGETKIGEGCVVGNSVIGKNCIIGKDVTIEGSYIWDSVVIQDGCFIKDSIIADKAFIGRDSRIDDSSIVSFGVHLSPGTVVTARKRLTAYKRKLSSGDYTDDEDEEDSEDDIEAVENQGTTYTYVDSESEDEDESRMVDRIGQDMEDLGLSDSDSSISAFSDDEDHVAKKKSGRTSSFATSASEENEEDSWHKEAVMSLRTALEKNHPVEVAGLELNSLRMANDATWYQVRRAAAAAFVARIDELMEQKQTAATTCKQLLGRWQPLLTRMIHGILDQIDFLLAFQKECSFRQRGASILLHVVQKFYELDLVEEDAVNRWWKDDRSSKDPKMAKARALTQPFVTWLAEAEEEDEDEDEDDSE